jgi:3-oxoacyl-[acyl-carrier protein] reductase
MDLGLNDRVYIVTGGSRGLGKAVASELVREGAKVVVSSRSAEGVAAAVEDLGSDASDGVVADNAAVDTPQRLVDAAFARFGRLDGALISVGGPPPGPVMEKTRDEWTSSFEAIFLGGVSLATTVASRLGEGGSIAFILSTSVRQPIDRLAISNGLRPGLAMVAKTLANELGPRGIRVNGLLPGRIDTERIRELDAASGDPEAARQAALKSIPLGRSGEPAELGRAAAFLLSPAAGFITGAMLPVDGGMTHAL